jgi:hypothetical protein
MSEFDFVIAQAKGNCGGSVLYKCTLSQVDGSTNWQQISGSCSGTCIQVGKSCGQQNISVLDNCTNNNVGQEGSVGCICS